MYLSTYSFSRLCMQHTQKHKKFTHMSLIKHNHNSLFPKFSTLWEDFFGRDVSDKDKGRLTTAHVPAVNIEESKKAFQLSLAVPGMHRSDFKIDVSGGILSISAQKEEKQDEKDTEGRYTRREFSYHAFSRSFALPSEADEESITAQYKEGILAIHIPKKKHVQTQDTQQIEVK